MPYSEEEKDEMFHPQPDEEDIEAVSDTLPDAGLGYHSVIDKAGNIRLFDDCGTEIDIERPPSDKDPVYAADDGLSPAQRQWVAQYERRYHQPQTEEETSEPSYLQQIRETKIQCDNCGKTESLETKSCMGGAKDTDTDEIYAVFGCNCGHTENIPAEDLPPNYIREKAIDENAIEQIVADIKWRREMGLD